MTKSVEFIFTLFVIRKKGKIPTDDSWLSAKDCPFYLTQKNNSKKLGNIKKIVSPLHPQKIKMLRRNLHIESMNRFSHKGDYAGCGACNAAE